MRGNGMDDGVVSFVMAEGWAPTPPPLWPPYRSVIEPTSEYGYRSLFSNCGGNDD